jgi:hypothetical protein
VRWPALPRHDPDDPSIVLELCRNMPMPVPT